MNSYRKYSLGPDNILGGQNRERHQRLRARDGERVGLDRGGAAAHEGRNGVVPNFIMILTIGGSSLRALPSPSLGSLTPSRFLRSRTQLLHRTMRCQLTASPLPAASLSSLGRSVTRRSAGFYTTS